MPDLSQRAAVKVTREQRVYPVQLEVRAKTGATVEIEGYASVYDEPYEMWDMFGPYEEVVRGGAGAKTLGENPKVQLLLNHTGLSMGYTKAGTLRIAEDTTGLHMQAEVNTERSDVRDMVLAIEDKNVDEMSFAFRVTRQVWSPDYLQRDIVEYDLHRGDVSVVNFGANPATSVEVALRGLDLDRLDEAQARALMRRLEQRFPAPVVVPPETSSRERPLSLARAQALAQG